MKRAAFITIGASPRPDILEEMRPWWETRGGLEIDEIGALDGLTPEEIAALAPEGHEERLVSRSRDGSEVVLRADWVHGRVLELVRGLDERPYDFVVLLCTGRFEGLASRHPLVRAQAVVDHGVAAFSEGSDRVGVLVPKDEQREAFGGLTSWASPYSGDRFEVAARELRDAELVVMHCMGYTEAMRDRFAELTGKPVLLARRLVAAAVAQLV